jgi:hypothetical protein
MALGHFKYDAGDFDSADREDIALPGFDSHGKTKHPGPVII